MMGFVILCYLYTYSSLEGLLKGCLKVFLYYILGLHSLKIAKTKATIAAQADKKLFMFLKLKLSFKICSAKFKIENDQKQ